MQDSSQETYSDTETALAGHQHDYGPFCPCAKTPKHKDIRIWVRGSLVQVVIYPNCKMVEATLSWPFV